MLTYSGDKVLCRHPCFPLAPGRVLSIRQRRKAILEDPSSELYPSATAFAEACWIVARGRVSLSVPTVIAAIDDDERITVVPLDRTVVERSIDLEAIGEMHDRQIVATALVFEDRGETVALLTKDGNIIASGLIDVVW